MKRLIMILVFLASPLWALDPSEMLEDPALEARARALDFEIRCVQCQSEAVASSNATWAKDARRAIREQIASGATDAEVKAWFQARYGDFALMDPPKGGTNWLIWLAGPAFLLTALALAFGAQRSRRKLAPQDGLSADEQARLDELLKK